MKICMFILFDGYRSNRIFLSQYLFEIFSSIYFFLELNVSFGYLQKKCNRPRSGMSFLEQLFHFLAFMTDSKGNI